MTYQTRPTSYKVQVAYNVFFKLHTQYSSLHVDMVVELLIFARWQLRIVVVSTRNHLSQQRFLLSFDLLLYTHFSRLLALLYGSTWVIKGSAGE